MLVTEYVFIKMRKDKEEYYKEKGYVFNVGETVKVKTTDLPQYSGVLVQYKCDNPECGKICKTHYQDYKRREKALTYDGKDFCPKCSIKNRYERLKQTNPQKAKEIEEKRFIKIRETLKKRYGIDNPMKNPDFVNNLKESVKKKYGVDNVVQNPEIRAKLMNNLGVDSKLEIVSNKDGKKYYRYKGVACSHNQKFLWELFGGELNSFVENMYTVDILFNNKIYFEYNGTGHELDIKMGKITKEDFLKKEAKRYYTLKGKGYKQIVFESIKKNTLPQEDVLLSIKDFALEFLKESENNWIKFDYDNFKIKTKFGEIDYDFSFVLNKNNLDILYNKKQSEITQIGES